MIRLDNMSKTYQKPGQSAVRALQNINLELAAGECLAILGPSGSGKTTLMNMMGLLDRPDSGTYRLGEREVFNLADNELAAIRNRTIGFVFQSFHLLPRTTALENVQLPLLYSRNNPVPLTLASIRQRSLQALQDVGLEQRSTHYSHELSGGQQQRVAIARALVNQPELILADEPTGNLDSATQTEILDLFMKINQQGTTLVFITHNMEVARRARRVIELKDGCITSDHHHSR
jgi:putative ABC transport system ATP-binding protein